MIRSWISAAVLCIGSSALFLPEGLAQMKADRNPAGEAGQGHPYVGMWVTEDGYIRHELLANGRYVEARGTREKAYQGRYEVTGNHIEYWDDTGFTADGTFVDENTLHHAGMIFYRDGGTLERQ